MKRFRQPAALLFGLLTVSALLMAAVGLVLKYDTARESRQIQETLAIAVPFVLIRGDVALPQSQPSDVGNKAGHTAAPQGETTPGQGGGMTPPVQEQVPFVFQEVEESYFDQVLFVGDSRTEGLKLYGRLGNADYFANAGMSVFNLFDKTVGDQNFSAQTLRQLLGAREYRAIYLMLGINEVGYPHSSLEQQYAAVVRQLRELQPEALLILQGNLGVTRSKAERQSYFSAESVTSLNGLIAALADGKSIFYLPPAEGFSDEEGYLRPEVTGDGVHPYAAEYLNWAAWLKGHGLVPAGAEAAPNPIEPPPEATESPAEAAPETSPESGEPEPPA